MAKAKPMPKVKIGRTFLINNIQYHKVYGFIKIFF